MPSSLPWSINSHFPDCPCPWSLGSLGWPCCCPWGVWGGTATVPWHFVSSSCWIPESQIFPQKGARREPQIPFPWQGCWGNLVLLWDIFKPQISGWKIWYFGRAAQFLGDFRNSAGSLGNNPWGQTDFGVIMGFSGSKHLAASLNPISCVWKLGWAWFSLDLFSFSCPLWDLEFWAEKCEDCREWKTSSCCDKTGKLMRNRINWDLFCDSTFSPSDCHGNRKKNGWDLSKTGRVKQNKENLKWNLGV